MPLPTFKWFKVDGASPEAILLLRDRAPLELPQDYVDLLVYSNGGEGELPEPYLCFCLDSTETATSPEQLSLYQRLCPGWFVFGGNGGSELFALDFIREAPYPVVAFDGIDPEGPVAEVASDFSAFLQLLVSN